jgi:hypothetical protein
VFRNTLQVKGFIQKCSVSKRYIFVERCGIINRMGRCLNNIEEDRPKWKLPPPPDETWADCNLTFQKYWQVLGYHEWEH